MTTNVIRCGGCRQPLATSDSPGAISVAGIGITGKRGLVLKCPECGHPTSWHKGQPEIVNSHLTIETQAPHTVA